MTFEASSECGEGVALLPPVGSGGDGREADRQLRRIARRRAGLDVEEARWLVIARRASVHLDHGCASFVEYVERVLDHGPKAAAERIRVAEAIEDLPVTRAALARGEVTWSAVREITRVVATPDNEAEWIDEVRGKTAREVEVLVAGRRAGDRPVGPTDPDLRMRTVRLELSPESYALWCAAQKAVGAESDDELAGRR